MYSSIPFAIIINERWLEFLVFFARKEQKKIQNYQLISEWMNKYFKNPEIFGDDCNNTLPCIQFTVAIIFSTSADGCCKYISLNSVKYTRAIFRILCSWNKCFHIDNNEAYGSVVRGRIMKCRLDDYSEASYIICLYACNLVIPTATKRKYQ